MSRYGNKYHNIRELGYDSRKEKRRHEELLLMQKAGVISDLATQVPFQLIPTQREPDTVGPRGGKHPGKLLERGVDYVADFAYWRNGEYIVEDVKSPATRTPEYIIKRKLMLYVHGIRVHEV